MSIKSSLIVFAILQALIISQNSFASDVISWSKADNGFTATVHWCVAQIREENSKDCKKSESGLDEQPKISEEDSVNISVTNFNFVNFDLDLIVEEEVIESYVYLNGLWSQLLGGSTLDLIEAYLSSTKSALVVTEPKVVSWWKDLRRATVKLSEIANRNINQSYLTVANLETIEKDQTVVLALKYELNQVKTAALDEVNSFKRISEFNSVDEQHQKLIGMLDSFLLLSEKSIVGHTTLIKKRDVGTYVEISVQSLNRFSGVKHDNKSINLSYLSESKNPIIFHAGLTVSQLDDTKFNTIRSLGGRDLFASIRDDETSEEIAVFASYPIFSAGDNKWFASIGTDVEDLGENIYFGLSHRFRSKWIASIGGVYGRQQQGVELVADMPNGRVFELIQEDREFELFLSLSYQLF